MEGGTNSPDKMATVSDPCGHTDPAEDETISSTAPKSNHSGFLFSLLSQSDNKEKNTALTSEALASDTADNMPVNNMTADSGCSNSVENPFQINMSCIEAVPVNEQDSELQDLGLTVFDQEQFEQDVMAQVDQAFKLEEQQRLKKMLQKELQTVQDEIRGTKQELKPLEKVLQMSKAQAPSKEVQRRLVSIKQQKDNKQKQLKKLKAKEKKLVGQLNGEANLLEDDGDEDEGDSVKDLAEMLGIGVKSQETEMERKIRLGEMTPFGSMVTEQNKKKAQPGPSDQMSDFEKYLLDQGKKVKQGRIKHLKRNHSTSSLIDSQKSKKDSSNEPSLKKTKNGLHASPSAPMLSRGPNDGRRNSGIYKTTSSSEEKTNRFDEKDKRWYRPSEIDFSKWKIGRRKRRYPKLRHNFSEDPNLSDGEDDGEDCYYDDPDFAPNERELQNSWLEDTEICNDEPGVLEKRSKLQHQNHKGVSRSGKGLKVGIEQDDEEFDLGAIKSRFKGRKQSRDSPVGHIADDGNMKNYESRIKKWKNEKLQKKMERIESGYDVEEDGSNSEEDMEFDGGFKVPGEIWKRLYKYQRIGVKWLWELHNQQAGGIVGDEMGLGKTIQIIAFLAGLRYSQLPDRIEMTRYQGLGPTIIIVPATVMHQWVREFHTWWPPFRVAILHSSGSFTTSEESLVRSVVQNNGILITGFSTMLIKQELILQYDWHYVILDEGHKIRNPDAQITLACKQFRTSHRLILSGSPVQNNLKELWSLFDFVFPGKLGTLPDFMTHFSVPIVQGGYSNASQVQVQTAYKCACVLRDTINPYLLRRMKADVKNNLKLPNKNEQVLFCRLTDEQKEVYQEYLDSKECQMIISGNFMAFPGLITLRKISNHPDLSTGGPKEFGMIPEGYTEQSVAYGYWKRSGKMIVVESLLKLWKKQNHKVLLFSQSSQMLDILEKFVNDQGYTYLRMDGKTTISARQPVIQKFNTDPNLFLFLLTTRVGGLGVNLTGADRVLIYDPDWNPSTDTQARERAWRIGQKNQVTIYRLLTTGTIEEKIYHRQIFKQFLTNRVLKDPKQRRFFKSNDLYELFTLGDDNPKGSTETSAIFAGTGSDVKVKPSAQRPKDPTKLNRFDIKKSKEKSCEALGKIDKAQSAPSPIPTEDKLAKMREIARKLSEQIGQQKQDQEDTCSVKSEVEDGAREGNAPDTVNISTCSAGASSECGHGSSPVPGTSTDNPSELPSSPQASKDTTDSPQSSSKKGKHKKKSKKKAKDAVFEGQKIAHLDKLGSAKPEKPDKTPASLQDDYVLQKLFKKTGIHSAMQHDKIMMSSNPDYALVEGEADRVAKEAARALKASRSQCHRAATGIPTWTGSSGVVATSKSSKPRFGQKKNTKLLPSVKPAAGPDTTSPVKKKSVKEETTTSSKTRHFDGSSAGSQTLTKTLSSSSSVNMLSSDDLLARMRARNHLTVTLTEDGTESTLRTEIGSQDMELMADIRNYVAFQASMDGQATTQELLHKFADCLAAQDSAKFKAMLKQICDFSKRNDIGVWQLKPEFR